MGLDLSPLSGSDPCGIGVDLLMGAPAFFMLDTGPKTPPPSTPIFCLVADTRLLASRLAFTLGNPAGDKHKRTRTVSPYPHPLRGVLAFFVKLKSLHLEEVFSETRRTKEHNKGPGLLRPDPLLVVLLARRVSTGRLS
jgi:hypothetical protein